jgi:hypothetical protein
MRSRWYSGYAVPGQRDAARLGVLAVDEQHHEDEVGTGRRRATPSTNFTLRRRGTRGEDRAAEVDAGPPPPVLRSESQWRTMPACDGVKQTNTPTEYSGMRACTSPLKITRRMAATDARARCR